MPKLSAGLLLYRETDGLLEVLLGHPGGPFWARKDDGAWSIPKGEYTEGRTLDRRAAEFVEETGAPPPAGVRIELAAVRQAGGKVVTAFAVPGDLDPADATSNTFILEWPRGSGIFKEFPEIDRVAWFDLTTARAKLLTGQRPLLDRLEEALGRDEPGGSRSR